MLDIDGHPKRNENSNSFYPPVTLPRRMWASSQVEFLTPLLIGNDVTRRSQIISVTPKMGRNGDLVFVNIEHTTFTLDVLAVRETQSLVYRQAASLADSTAPQTPAKSTLFAEKWDISRMIVPNEALLFRFSALTFNSHRIHYDLPYAKRHEGYRGLVVQGPLIAALLLDLAEKQFGMNSLQSFHFRAISPGICGEKLHLSLRRTTDGIVLGAFSEQGRQIMAANAVLA